MQTVRTIKETRAAVAIARNRGLIIGFVPTMGALHAGHQALMRRAREDCGFVVASIFVNPLQFGPQEDYERYPRDLERDAQMAEAAGVDLLFAPSSAEMYPPGFATSVEVAGLTAGLCGAHRPGHFRGVATVVTKLLNIVRPDRAYFGQKDAQQLAVIRRLAADLDMQTEIIGVPTVREADGLAISSRNAYLSAEERRAAAVLYRSLQAAAEAARRGERSPARLQALMWDTLAAERLARPEYAEVVDAETLQPLARLAGRALLAVAARVGPARLIDNIVLRVDESGVEADTL